MHWFISTPKDQILNYQDELKEKFDPSQETYEEYLRRKSMRENAAQGGVIGKPGGLVEPGRLEAAYLCGPDTMMRSCRIALEEAGLAPDRIATEHFTTSAQALSTSKRAVAETNVDIEEGVAVQARAGGLTRKFMMNPMQQTVLSAGQAAGFELPYSCKAGMCCTCRCLLVSGEVEMDANYSLEPWEI